MLYLKDRWLHSPPNEFLTATSINGVLNRGLQENFLVMIIIFTVANVICQFHHSLQSSCHTKTQKNSLQQSDFLSVH